MCRSPIQLMFTEGLPITHRDLPVHVCTARSDVGDVHGGGSQTPEGMTHDTALIGVSRQFTE
jgi:hypothetical protein